MHVISVDTRNLSEAREGAREAAEVLKRGGLVVFPSETVYGVAAWARSASAMEALRRVKQAADDTAFAVHLASAHAAEQYADLTHPATCRVLEKLLPGPVTVRVDVSEDVIDQRLRQMGLPGEARRNLYSDRTVSLRCPQDAFARAFLAAAPSPVVAAGANLPGKPLPTTAEQALEQIGEEVGIVLDGGPCRYGKGSTVVRVRNGGHGPAISVEHEGVYDERTIRRLTRWTMLLVCSGNTCRSPMAETIARHELASERGLAEDELDAAGIRVVSAGVLAAPGMPASPEAVEAVAKIGLDLSAHRSQPLTDRLIEEADVIYCMTDSHLAAVLEIAPQVADKVHRLDPSGDIPDPIGADVTTYQRTAEMIRRRLKQRIREQQP